ncbi:MAG TPA: low temperature requirement protein A [Candidatus Thermoplasmatota archaeon]|nr:low temperature requirement protein A [Candidatus Thermoplasmatota archaeon]
MTDSPHATHQHLHAGHLSNTAHQWWMRPRLRSDEDEGRERKTSWLELFYDLVFVVIIAQVSHGLAEHPDVDGVATLVLLLLPAWWLWVGGTFYTERFESEDLSHRLATFLQIFPLVLLAALAHDGLGRSAAYAVTYAVGRLLIVFLWLRAGIHDRRAGPLTRRYATGFTASAAIFLASAAVDAPLRYQLWVVALTIDVLTPLFTAQQQRGLPRYSTGRLPERFGLFIIIVLGENVTSVVSGVADAGLARPALVAGTLGMLVTFASWWLYFDIVQLRPARNGPLFGFARSYLHFPLVLSLTATAASVLALMAHDAADAHVRWLLAGSVALMFVSLALLQHVLVQAGPHSAERPLRHLTWAMAAAALAVGAFGEGWGALRLLSALFALHLILIVYGSVQWARGRLS